MRYRQFNTDIWNDEYVAELSPEEFKAYIYYDKNDKVNMCGIYKLPMRKKVFDLQMNKDQIVAIEQKFETDRIYFFHEDWVFLPKNHVENQYSTAENIVRSFNTELKKIPYEVKEYFFSVLGLKYVPPFNQEKIKTKKDRKEIVIEIEMKGNESRVGGRVGFVTDVNNKEQFSMNEQDYQKMDEYFELQDRLKKHGRQN